MTSTQLQPIPVLPAPQVGWLIEMWDETPGDEHSAGWLCSCGSGALQFTCVDSWAVRFARKEDAEAMIRILTQYRVVSVGVGHSLKALEHLWG